ncbi:MAG TPA: cob(I)yrinic acid a,c-diamide adenosyltransferase [Nitrospirales bacterium]|nr:cob(I)yrinic acid a,c-diamide adenosyltransferase [Nitrospirales bacterium]HIA13482.1 cob(I)yrinic acid a,c-diamide adenosyltransferase [Nitrospirales bacterium]HIB53622.1 cob(I)yrinic acid a,c-diamide adenosyltransferase [Nitrospirales bacterium]HIC04941.1 cob(I)yrinic acid a,c-diamide adenosyltransferase [Nitrospirales bacterium]HIN33505.1 cob(I)yrinic acid a,c-diamide adenosyltransferase [Nitrospirales bacterium]
MMRISKVYTRTGDAGKTRLAGGQQVFKDDRRVEAYGTVDELNAVLGATRAFIVERLPENTTLTTLDTELHVIQSKLFDLGGILATAPGTSFPNMPEVTEDDVTRLENLIDSMNVELEPLKEFILPGGGKVTSLLHMARTICRRAERQCVTLSREDSLGPTLLMYLNRLSDALFVFARWVAKVQGEPEHFWTRG